MIKNAVNIVRETTSVGSATETMVLHIHKRRIQCMLIYTISYSEGPHAWCLMLISAPPPALLLWGKRGGGGGGGGGEGLALRRAIHIYIPFHVTAIVQPLLSALLLLHNSSNAERRGWLYTGQYIHTYVCIVRMYVHVTQLSLHVHPSR